MASQVQHLQKNFFSKTYSNDSSKKSASKSETKDFSEVLSDKSEEQKKPEEPKANSKESGEVTKNDAVSSKETKDNTKAEEVEEVEEVEVVEEVEIVDSVKEESIEELNSLIQDLIQSLQTSSTIDVEKLQSILEGVQKDSINLEEIKTLLDDLQLNTDLKMDDELSNKLVKVTKLLETIEELVTQEQVTQISTIKTNQLSNETSSTMSSDESVDDEGLNVDSNINVEVKKDDETQQQSSETKISAKDTNKDKELFVNKNSTKDSSPHQKDVDLVGIKNIEAEVFKDNDISSVNKSLENIPKQDINIFTQIIEGAKINVSEDISEMIIKLKPDNLGKLSMKIVIDRGMLVAKFDVESQMVKEAIESNLEDLRNALKDKGFEIQEFDVSVNKDSDQSESQFGYFNKRQKKKMSISNDLTLADSYVSTQHSAYGLNSTINYLG